MFRTTQRFSGAVTMTLLAMVILACEGEETTAPTINCAAATALSAAEDACEPDLARGLWVNAADEIVADTAGGYTETALAVAHEE